MTTTKGSAAEHAALVNAILAECGAMPGVVLGANASGRAMYTSDTGRSFWVPYGWPDPAGGGPDIIAAVIPGRMVCLEVKSGEATTTKAQRACHAALRAVGVAVHVVRSVEEAREALTAVVKDSAGAVRGHLPLPRMTPDT